MAAKPWQRSVEDRRKEWKGWRDKCRDWQVHPN